MTPRLVYTLFVLGSFCWIPQLKASETTRPEASHENCPFAASSEIRAEFPSEVGQDAFAALAEMKELLESDPNTDWARVDLGALRDHLVDMNRVVLEAEVGERDITGGFEAVITGKGRTLDAIQRMIPAHARFAGRAADPDVSVQTLPTGDPRGAGVVLRVTTVDAAAVDRLRGLGFFGFLVSGSHHRPHHRAMAAGLGHP